MEIINKMPKSNGGLARILTWATAGILEFFIVPEATTGIITSFERYKGSVGPGLRLCVSFWKLYQKYRIVPLIHDISFDSEHVTTRDGVQFSVWARMYFEICDPYKAIFKVPNGDFKTAVRDFGDSTFTKACHNLSARELLGDLGKLAGDVMTNLNTVADDFGVKVTRFQFTNVQQINETAK